MAIPSGILEHTLVLFADCVSDVGLASLHVLPRCPFGQIEGTGK